MDPSANTSGGWEMYIQLVVIAATPGNIRADNIHIYEYKLGIQIWMHKMRPYDYPSSTFTYFFAPMTSTILMMTYPNDGRKLQRLIIAILKQGLAISINRMNYVKTYTLVEGKIKRDEQKIVLIKTTEDKKEKLVSFISKQHPQQTPELTWLATASGDEAGK